MLTGSTSAYAERCGEGRIRVSVRGRDGDHAIDLEIGRCRFDVELRGGVEFSLDEDSVERMGRRAYLQIDERSGGDRRRLEVTPGPDRRPVHAWFVDGERREFDGEAREWLGATLPVIFRASGIDAPARVGRILERSGVEGVLAEVPLILGDHTQRVYLEELLAQADLSAGELARGLRLAGREIGSDHEQAEWLIQLARSRSIEGDLRDRFLRALDSVGSEHQRGRVLAALD